ncbi:MAG TPA: class I SAM-dependent methyltransferase, partial [Dehalococcoidia bacterium]|nr:class I SAM-dependent methyltransferase [Dehalococcoidia bacterium]
LALIISVGHRTGLFDALAGLPPSTSEEVADSASLNERYVREWLGAMTVGGIVEYDAATQKYSLPPEHAAYTTRASGPDNMAFFTTYFPLMGTVEDQLVESFARGGGVPYEAYPKFQEIQREETARVYDATLIDVALPLAPGLVERLEQGIDVADFGTGAGHAINLMARAFPKSRFTGFDISETGLAIGRAEAKEWGLRNASFEARDSAEFVGGRERFDLITALDVIHDLAKPRETLQGIYDSLGPGGVFFCVDMAASSRVEENIDHPMAPFLYGFSIFYCMTTSLAYGGAGWGTLWGEQMAVDELKRAGFKDVSVEKVEGDILNNYYVARKQ